MMTCSSPDGIVASKHFCWSACDCKEDGATTCDARTGICQCLPGVTGAKCDHCLPRWVLVPDRGCKGKADSHTIHSFYSPSSKKWDQFKNLHICHQVTFQLHSCSNPHILLQLYSTTYVPLHTCTNQPMFHSTNVPLHPCSTPYMFHSTHVSLHTCSKPLVFHSIYVPLNPCSTPHMFQSIHVSLHTCSTPFVFHSTHVLLYRVELDNNQC